MKNAHERFGKVVYVRRTEKASTNIRVHLDAFVGEELPGERVDVPSHAARKSPGIRRNEGDPHRGDAISGHCGLE